MKKEKNFFKKIIFRLLIAALLVNQAVFLLPAGDIFAQGTTGTPTTNFVPIPVIDTTPPATPTPPTYTAVPSSTVTVIPPVVTTYVPPSTTTATLVPDTTSSAVNTIPKTTSNTASTAPTTVIGTTVNPDLNSGLNNSTVEQSSAALRVDIIYPPSAVSNNVSLFARTNVLADKVTFTVKGSTSKVYEGELSADSSNFYFNYKFVWDVLNYQNGDYSIIATASKAGQNINSSSVVIKVNKAINPITTVQPPLIISSTTVEKAAIPTILTTGIEKLPSISIISPVNNFLASGALKINLRLLGEVKELKLNKIKNNTESFLGLAAINPARDGWSYVWDTAKDLDGIYTIFATGISSSGTKILSNKINIIIKNTLNSTPEVSVPVIKNVNTAEPTVDKTDQAAEILPDDNKNIVKPTETPDLVSACKQNKIESREDCFIYGKQKQKEYGFCKDLNKEECDIYIKNVLLSDFMEKKTFNALNYEIKSLINKKIEIRAGRSSSTPAEMSIKNGKINELINPAEVKNFEQILPFKKTQDPLNLIVVATKEVADNETAASAALVIDSDNDSLPDDLEKRFGTDPYDSDSDQDGYGDETEINSGNNPVGIGQYTFELQAFDKAILNKVALEQPKTSNKKVNSNLAVKSIITAEKASSSEKSKLKLEGKALPNETIAIFIYSALPIVLTATADSNGNWVYELDKSLIDGKHEAYVVINDEKGNIKEQSAPFSFFIKDAAAVTQDEFVKNSSMVNVYDKTESMIKWYVIAGAAFIIFIAGLSLFYFRSKKIINIDAK